MSYQPVDVIAVSAWGARVGAVARDPRTGFYLLEYDPEWVRAGVELSPTSAPVRRSRHVFPALPEHTFQRLPPLLADALPDDFGNALTTAHLVAQHVPATQITALDRLAYLGARGMGALEFAPMRGPAARRSTAVELSDLVVMARQALTGSLRTEPEISSALSSLLAVGTSAGGARAKAVVAWNPITDELRSGQVDVPPGFEQWLLKLDGVGVDTELGTSAGYGRIEYAYYLMAMAAGITMMPSRLLLEGGRAHFMTRRFDRRTAGEKIHVQTLCAMAELDFKAIGAHDYAQLFDVVNRVVSEPERAAGTRAEVFRRMAFNVAAANCDDHTKNTSFELFRGSGWQLSPAYDVTHAHNPQGTWTAAHLMRVNGKGTDITRRDLLDVAARWEVPGARRVLDEVLAAVGSWDELALEAGVEQEARTHVGKDIAAFSEPLRARQG